MSLISGFLPDLIIGISLLALLAGIDWRAPNRRLHLATGLLAAILLTGVVALLQLRYRLVPYPFPLRYYLWVGGVFLAIGLCAFTRRIGLWRRLSGLLAVPLMLATALVLINADFQAYPSIQSLVGSGAAHQTSVEELLTQRHGAQPAANLHSLAKAQPTGALTPGSPTYGEAAEVSIPGTRSHFSARPAWVWVPPAYVAGKVDALPVLMLLGGSPGRTNDWLRAGFADRTAQAFAQRHNGLAPILVMPDANGSVVGDTECVDGSAGNAETYLTVDVPAFMHRQFGAPLGRSYAVAGFSEGGTCAAMLSLRHPSLFTGFADFSGLTSPSLTERVNAKVTAMDLFRGSMTSYLAHDPLELLRVHGLHGGAYFEVGANDTRHVQAQRQLVELARTTGLSVCASEVPGAGHTYAFWAQALADALPTLSAELSITPRPKPACTLASVKAAAAPSPTHTS
jgi:enterochelin esterase-like enzyme